MTLSEAEGHFAFFKLL